MTRSFLPTVFSIFMLTAFPIHAQKIRVACMGDSITYGAGITAAGTTPATWEGDKYSYSGPTLLDQDSYPSVLQSLLGDGYDVRNFGGSGRTVTGPGSGLFPYLGSTRDGNTPSGGYTYGVAFAPDIVLLMLGTNDTKTTLWATSQPRFKADYKSLVQTIQNLPSKPFVVICYPIPVEDSPKPNPSSGITESNRVLLLPLINEVVAETGAGFINTNPGMPAFSGLLSDQVHPNHPGAIQLAGIMDKGFPTISRDSGTNAPQNIGTRPQVSITSPVDRTVILTTDSLTISADATPETITGNGIGANAPASVVLPIVKVEFFNGPTKFSESTASPYSAVLSGLPVGSYSITARATNSAGLMRDSAPITVFVSAGALSATGVPFTGSYSQNFDALSRAVTTTTVPWGDNATIPGWYGATFASSTWTPSTAYEGDNGSDVNFKGLRSLGANWSRNRTLGTISFSQQTVWGIALLNATDSIINKITITYTGEQWRVSSSTANNKNILLEYSTTTASIATATGFSGVPQLTFTPPTLTSAVTTILDGKLPQNRTLMKQTITIAGGWNPAARLWLRWTTGSGQSSTVGIDDLTVTSGGSPATDLAIASETDGQHLTWNGVGGSTYRMETCTDLSTNNWVPASSDLTLTGNANVPASFTYPVGADASRFFRVKCLP